MEEHQGPRKTPAWIAGGVAAVVAVGLVGAIVALARGGDVARAIAVAYYVVGCGVMLVGSFPTGGVSMFRRQRPSRTPVGGSSLAPPSLVVGALLIGLGVVFDVTPPF